MNVNITCQLLGGLGNMLFGAATTYAIGLDNNLTPVLHINHKGALHTHPIDYINNIFRNFKIVDNIDEYYLYNEPTFTYTPIRIPTDKNIKLSGYFQCEKYFLKHRENILNLFSPTDEILNYIGLKYGYLYKNKTVSLHVRRGNYVNLSDIHPPITTEYCYKALEHFPNHNTLIFSDDIPYCKTIFKDKNFHFIENSSDITDLYMMSLCDHNIIANSTFSWWGAWLNKNNNTVICPSTWFGQNKYNSSDITPESWIKI